MHDFQDALLVKLISEPQLAMSPEFQALPHRLSGQAVQDALSSQREALRACGNLCMLLRKDASVAERFKRRSEVFAARPGDQVRSVSQTEYVDLRLGPLYLKVQGVSGSVVMHDLLRSNTWTGKR